MMLYDDVVAYLRSSCLCQNEGHPRLGKHPDDGLGNLPRRPERDRPGHSARAQHDIRGLWRVYPATAEARSQLLVRGLRIRKTLIQPSSTNPFILRDDMGEEKPATKVWVDNIPISVADSAIEEALVKDGCELRSPI